ncbi:uncharacterized protein LOC123295677 [Chrysoperla carnea]|uniref:uncharacterized protein LOC123295677 n=1 Tax=Chrysoperla carnea TaxID=189513 RepID=UPI001D097ECD|nr:uncharacterized protein LOC123295677 [Chrysoperla carnea]
MHSLIIFLLFILLQILNCTAITGNSICRKETACRCRYNDGTGIDLKETSIVSVTLANYSTIYFHPCTDSTLMPDKACNNTSICIKSNGPVVTYQNIGTAAEGEFIPPEIHQTVNRLEYTHNDIHTIIALICVENFDQTHLVELPAVGAPNPKVVNLGLYSPTACIVDLPGEGMSSGSILVMFFLLTSAIYFIGGGTALYFLRGARGREMIPHVDFWTDLPYLVRDGAVFLQNGCKVTPPGATVYDQI